MYGNYRFGFTSWIRSICFCPSSASQAGLVHRAIYSNLCIYIYGLVQNELEVGRDYMEEYGRKQVIPATNLNMNGYV